MRQGTSARARRSKPSRYDNKVVTEQPGPSGDTASLLLSFYDAALPSVYGYLSARCGEKALAEEPTAETFLAAVHTVNAPARLGDAPVLSMPWIIGVARHKLIDHWRRQARLRELQVVADLAEPPDEEHWARAPRRHARTPGPGGSFPSSQGRSHPALPGRPTCPRGGRPTGAHGPCDRGTARTGADLVPSGLLRGGDQEMVDPFEALRAPVEPTDPDPSFAARLRARVGRALGLARSAKLTGGATMPSLGHSQRTSPQPLPALTPYLAVSGAWDALSWYADALDAWQKGEPYVMPDGSVGHAELEIAGGVLMLSEEHPEIGVVAPLPGEGAPVTVHLSVADVDAVIDRAVASGAALERAPADYDYGRNGVFRDPFGHRWLVSSEPAPAGEGDKGAIALRHGDIAYASLFVPDLARAATFFSVVLGWGYVPGNSIQDLQVEGQSLDHGIRGGQPRCTLFLCSAVDDIAAAAGRVRDAGGTATEPHQEPSGRGLISECSDDQGERFAVFQPAGGTSGATSSVRATGSRRGDLGYVTMEVADSARARAFYGSVLGWQFVPGRVADGWQVRDVAPMVGMSGGHKGRDGSAHVPGGRYRGRRRPGAGEGRHGLRPAAPALRGYVHVQRRPGHALLPGAALSRRLTRAALLGPGPLRRERAARGPAPLPYRARRRAARRSGRGPGRTPSHVRPASAAQPLPLLRLGRPPGRGPRLRQQWRPRHR